MPSHLILPLLLSGAILAAPPLQVSSERTTSVQGECIGKKRVLSGPVRTKRIDPRRRCHVMMPILM